MNAVIHQTAYTILQQPFEEVAVEQLQQICNSYPFFTPAQILLAAKLQQNNSGLPDLIQNQMIASPCNSLWVNYLLNNNNTNNISEIFLSKQTTSTLLPDKDKIEMESLPSEQVPEEDENETLSISEATSKENMAIQEPEEPSYISEREQADHFIEMNQVSLNEPLEDNYAEINPVSEASQQAIAATFTKNEEDTSEATQVSLNNLSIAERKLITHTEMQANDTNQPEQISESHENDTDLEKSEKLSELIAAQWAGFQEPVEPEEELTYEPPHLYTIDYFGSLGITADLTREPQDKLSKQLLKFTDWLKIVKNQHSPDSPTVQQTEVDSIIPGIAQTSNETREIITETMAEVLVKQGKIDKAVQVYIKLSFLDPDKSAYFAKKIEQLKEM